MTDYSFLAIADVHLGAKLFSLPELYEDLKEDFVRAINQALLLKVKYLFVAGDLFDSNRPSPDLVKFVKEQTDMAKNKGLIVSGILGDHDKPVNGVGWMHLAGVVPVNRLGDPRFVGFDYDDNSMANIEKLKQLENPELVEWIFLHGQVPELFHFTQDKKRLDFKQLDVHGLFPNIKGVVLGDIHTPLESVILKADDPDFPGTYIGYCGSLGMVQTKEIDTKKGLLYFDGNELKREKFELSRKFLKMSANDCVGPINWVDKYAEMFEELQLKKKPLVIVEYTKETKDLLANFTKLYELCIVRTARQSTSKGDGQTSVCFRTEIEVDKNIDAALSAEFADPEIKQLAADLLNADDFCTVLDAFKNKQLE